MTETMSAERAIEILAMTANATEDRVTMGPRPARAVLAELNYVKIQLARTQLQLELARMHPEARQVAEDEIELWVAGGPDRDETPLAAQIAAERRRALPEGGDTPGSSQGLSGPVS